MTTLAYLIIWAVHPRLDILITELVIVFMAFDYIMARLIIGVLV